MKELLSKNDRRGYVDEHGGLVVADTEFTDDLEIKNSYLIFKNCKFDGYVSTIGSCTIELHDCEVKYMHTQSPSHEVSIEFVDTHIKNLQNWGPLVLKNGMDSIVDKFIVMGPVYPELHERFTLLRVKICTNQVMSFGSDVKINVSERKSGRVIDVPRFGEFEGFAIVTYKDSNKALLRIRVLKDEHPRVDSTVKNFVVEGIWFLDYDYDKLGNKELKFNIEKKTKRIDVEYSEGQWAGKYEVGEVYTSKKLDIYLSPELAIYAAGFYLTESEVKKIIKGFEK